MTLKELLEENPEYGDLPVVVYDGDKYHDIDGSGSVYVDEWANILVFSGN